MPIVCVLCGIVEERFPSVLLTHVIDPATQHGVWGDVGRIVLYVLKKNLHKVDVIVI